MTPFKFPPELFAQDIAIVGRKGSGKTYTAKGMAESLLALKRRVCIVDPLGVWWGLKSSVDGKKAGFAVVIFGGTHADVPINEHSGPALAHIVATSNLPSIVDLSEMLIGQRHNFMTAFADALYRENKMALHLIIDEADEFAPQQPLPETRRMLHHIDRIVRRGRVRGFRVMLITQRPAVLNKNVLSQANTLIAMKLTAPQDRNAINAWVEGQADAGQAKEVLGTLASLKRGEGWVWAPELDMLQRSQFPLNRTFDSSRSPEDDEVVEEPKTLAAVDISGITASFAAIEHEAKTVKELQAELTKLRKQASNSSVAAEPTGVSEAEVKRRIDEAIAAVPYVAPDPAISSGLVKAIDDIAAGIKTALEELAAAGAREFPRVARVLPRPEVPSKPAVKIPAMVPKPTYGNMIPPVQSAGDLKAPEQRIVDAIAWWDAAGVEWPSRHQVAFVAGYTVNGHFNNQVGTLRGRGLIDYPSGGTLCITNNGRMFARSPGAKPTRGELVARVLAVLKTEPMRRVFGVLVDRGALSRQDLAEAAGYTVNGHFNNIVGSLSGVGLVDYPTKGSVGLTSIFEGLL